MNLSRTAIWTWRRFSASSKTADRGPSITSSVISSPRRAGREGITIAPRSASIPLEGGAPFPAPGLLPQAGPDVGVEPVRVPRRFRRSADDPDVPPADLSRLLDDRGIRLVPLRARHPQAAPADVGRPDPRVGPVLPLP